jgi:hypothetical protein
MELALSRQTAIGIGVSAIAVAAMAVDHLLGDDPGLEDVPTFLISSGLTLAVAAVVFGIVVPRAAADPVRAAKHGLVLSALSVLVIVTIWLGLPFPIAGGGVALGLIGRGGSHRRRGTAAIVLGAAVILLGTVGYGVEAIRKTW